MKQVLIAVALVLSVALPGGCRRQPQVQTIQFQYERAADYPFFSTARRVHVGEIVVAGEADAPLARLAEEELRRRLPARDLRATGAEVVVTGELISAFAPSARPGAFDAPTASAGQGVVSMVVRINPVGADQFFASLPVQAEGTWHPDSTRARSAEELARSLTIQAVRDFAARTAPEPIVVHAPLPAIEDEIVQEANFLAAADNYSAALDLYLMALRQMPTSHELMHAVGLMYEAMGRFDLSVEYYRAANSLRPGVAYAAAVARVQPLTLRQGR